MAGLFTEHARAVADIQINGTTTSKKSDSCSDRLPNPSASRSCVCRVHGLCLVPRESMAIFKNSSGSPKCECFLSLLLLLHPSSSFSTAVWTLAPPTIFLHFPKVSGNFLLFFYSHCIQILFNLVSPSLMLSHSLPSCFNYSCCNFFLLLKPFFDFHSFNITAVSWIVLIYFIIFPLCNIPFISFFLFIFLLLLWVHIFPLQTSFHIYKYAIILQIIMDMSRLI